VVRGELAVRVVRKQAAAKTNNRISWICQQSILFASELDGGMIRGGHAMRLRYDDAVAASGFATIESLVCTGQDRGEVHIRADHLSDTCGEGNLDVSGGKRNGGRGETVAEFFGDVESPADVGLGQDGSKLFAPQTRDEVGAAKTVAEQVGDRAKSEIASMVAVAVVDRFE
jgi:hypothetical protein